MSNKTTSVEFIRSVGTEAGSFSPGQRVDIAEHLAAQWVKNGYCNVVGAQSVAEGEALRQPAPSDIKAETEQANDDADGAEEEHAPTKKARTTGAKHPSKK